MQFVVPQSEEEVEDLLRRFLEATVLTDVAAAARAEHDALRDQVFTMARSGLYAIVILEKSDWIC